MIFYYMSYDDTLKLLYELIPNHKLFLKAYDLSQDEIFDEICEDIYVIWWAQKTEFTPPNILALEDFVSMIL